MAKRKNSGTGAWIGCETDDGKIMASYLEDGRPSVVAPILLGSYNTSERARELVGAGSRSALDEKGASAGANKTQTPGLAPTEFTAKQFGSMKSQPGADCHFKYLFDNQSQSWSFTRPGWHGYMGADEVDLLLRAVAELDSIYEHYQNDKAKEADSNAIECIKAVMAWEGWGDDEVFMEVSTFYSEMQTMLGCLGDPEHAKHYDPEMDGEHWTLIADRATTSLQLE